MLTRRGFIRSSAAAALGFHGLRRLLAGDLASATARAEIQGPYGDLIPDPDGVIDLPSGFTYRLMSKVGERMDDGLFVPSLHDGMGAFPGPDGATILIRNHEVESTEPAMGAFGPNNERLGRIDQARIYDRGYGDRPLLGGTTTIVYDTRSQRLLKHFLSLAGTGRNCSGGPTPWKSWISCEEWTQLADSTRRRDHGYNFEVPATAQTGLVAPVPLRAMGRFCHEAVAVDPRTGWVYQTEDRDDGMIYRFRPHRRGRLAEGGRLETLSIRDRPSLDTRNWARAGGRPAAGPVEVGRAMATSWLPVDNVDSPDDDLRHIGFAGGAARFARGEGMWFGRDAIYFACTNGGPARLGQIWRHVPGFDGQEGDASVGPGTLELFIESVDATLLQNADNLTVAPWGGLFVCEDGPGENRLLQVTGAGRVFAFARNRFRPDEFAGATFSPDGTTLFVNLQRHGMTVAISGRWKT